MLAKQFLQQWNFALLRRLEELLLNRWQCIDSIDFNGQRVLLHAPADRRNRLWPVAEKSSV